MKLFKAYTNGILLAGKSKIMTTVIFFITVLLAFVLAIPFRSALGQIAGNTMDLKSMIKGFDFTTYEDFLRSAHHAISPFISAAIWFGILYLLFTIFFAGGVLKILNGEDQKFSAGYFFKYCADFFFRFLRLAIYLIILQAILAVIIFLPFSAVVSFASETVQDEAVLFYMVLLGIIFYLFIFTLILTIGDYAKIILVINDSRKSLKSIWWGTKFVFRHFFSTYFLYVLLLITSIIIFAIYFYLDSAVGMVSAFTIFIMFLIQQIVIWMRTWIKILFLGSELSLYGLFPGIDIKPKEKEIVQNGETGNEGQSMIENPLPS